MRELVELCADDLFTADQKICTWALLLEIRNQATLRQWIAGITHNLAVLPRGDYVYAKGKVSLNILNILSTIMHACYFQLMHVMFYSLSYLSACH